MRLRHSLLLFVLVALVFLTQSCTIEEFFAVNFDLILQEKIPKNHWTPVFCHYFLHGFELQKRFIRVSGSIHSYDFKYPSRLMVALNRVDPNGIVVPGTKRWKLNARVVNGFFDATKKFTGFNFNAGDGLKGFVNLKSADINKDDQIFFNGTYSRSVNGELFSQLNVDMGIENRVLMASVDPKSLAEITIDNSNDIGTVKVSLLEKGTGKLNIIYMDSEGQFHKDSYPLKCN